MNRNKFNARCTCCILISFRRNCLLFAPSLMGCRLHCCQLFVFPTRQYCSRKGRWTKSLWNTIPVSCLSFSRVPDTVYFDTGILFDIHDASLSLIAPFLFHNFHLNINKGEMTQAYQYPANFNIILHETRPASKLATKEKGRKRWDEKVSSSGTRVVMSFLASFARSGLRPLIGNMRNVSSRKEEGEGRLRGRRERAGRCGESGRDWFLAQGFRVRGHAPFPTYHHLQLQSVFSLQVVRIALAPITPWSPPLHATNGHTHPPTPAKGTEPSVPLETALLGRLRRLRNESEWFPSFVFCGSICFLPVIEQVKGGQASGRKELFS